MLSISDDYTIYDDKNDVVGELDGAIFTIGGKWFGRMRADHADPLVMTVLKLFCGYRNVRVVLAINTTVFKRRRDKFFMFLYSRLIRVSTV